jgi:hypothetical protein
MKLKRRVWQNKANKQKLVTIPKDCDIEPEDYVWVEKIETSEKKWKKNMK